MLKQIGWAGIAAMLFVAGMFVELSRAMPEGSIHIRVAPGHAITTPDFVAAALLVASATVIALGLRPHREHILDAIREHPTVAAALLIAVGLAAGFVIGLGTGARFSTPLRSLARQAMRLIDGAFVSIGDAMRPR